MQNNKNSNLLLTYADMMRDEEFPMFNNDNDRIKYMKNAYKNMSLAKSFSIFYGVEVSPEITKDKSINQVNIINLGEIYAGTVKEITKTQISFSIPGVKEEIISKENFSTCIDYVQNYLLSHNNKLLFEVREKKDNRYYVSVISAYYKNWVDTINKAIQREDGIEVHIDSLVQGGYLCHTPITTLNNLTGRNYTHSVFIPGSHIVLNIEHDFEKWIGQDVVIVPQKFVEFRKNFKTGETENSLVGSRKKVLQIMGMKNLAEMYNKYLLSTKENVKFTPETYEGVVTGIINAQKKQGVFIELQDKFITGLLPMEAYDLLDYKPGDKVNVCIDTFEVQEGKDPFIFNKKGNVVKSNTRPVFRLAV